MNTNFTPGPWKAERKDEGLVNINLVGDGAIQILGYNTEGNARLIAAAPELLKELETIKTELAHLYHNGQIKANAPERERIQIMIVNAEYAIEKATQAQE